MLYLNFFLVNLKLIFFVMIIKRIEVYMIIYKICMKFVMNMLEKLIVFMWNNKVNVNFNDMLMLYWI